MNAIDEKIKLNIRVRTEVNQPEEKTGSTWITRWIDRFQDWINFFRDVVKILAE